MSNRSPGSLGGADAVELWRAADRAYEMLEGPRPDVEGARIVLDSALSGGYRIYRTAVPDLGVSVSDGIGVGESLGG